MAPTTLTGTTPGLSITREILRVYDQRFLEVEPPVRRTLATATKTILDGLLTDDVRKGLAEAHRLRAFCIENEMFEELERLISDEVAGRKEGAVVVGGRVYAVYPYLRGVPRQDADITAEVGVEHRLDTLSWDKSGRLRVKGSASVARVQARNPEITLLLSDGEVEYRYAASVAEDGFEALIDLPEKGAWRFRVEVKVLGLTRASAFGAVRGPEFREPKARDGIAFSLTDALEISLAPATTEKKRRFWEFRRASRG
ncbi:hypothetical protein GCM10027589_52550 [Actinocorallia lasiicapitis]